MRKVVYNCCHGGFGLSEAALTRLVELGLEVPEDPYKTPEEVAASLDIPRHHPLLVRVVQELGKKASAFSANLKIATIEGRLYRITEYDGLERVETPGEDWVVIE